MSQYNEEGLQICYGTVKRDPSQTLTTDLHFINSYGTGGYLEACVDESDNGCVVHGKTHNGTCEFIISDNGPDFTVTIIRGDEDHIKNLIKNEIDHFDSEVRWK